MLEKESDVIAERDPEVVASLVRRCIDYKASVVEEDELDRGRRAVLNLGHTMGHALEVTTGYGSLSHGTAVALGLLVALAVSERTLGLDPQVRERTRRPSRELGPPRGHTPAAGRLPCSSPRPRTRR